jgi:hypothetical protein
MANTNYEPESLYSVLLARPIKVGRSTLLPTERVQLKGKVVAANQADIIAAEKVAQ